MRWLLALVVAAAGVALAYAGLSLLGDEEPEELLPDLDQALPTEVAIVQEGDTYRLVFGSAVDNVGRGPLLIEGERADRSQRVMEVRQLVRSSDGSTRERQAEGEIRYVRSETHAHWHLLDFERYELREAAGGALVEPDAKTGFCLGDRYETDPETRLDGEPEEAVWTEECGRRKPGLLRVAEGISPGYGDDYEPALEGQFLDVTSVPAGRYLLVHRANPERALEESDYENNAASLLVDRRVAPSAVTVDLDNFVRAETERMIAALQALAGGVNRWSHVRTPTPVDSQTVIRMNRDTLYSFAVVDISEGATVTIPDGGDRYVSVMVVNQDHYINGIFRRPGEHSVDVDVFDTPWVVLAARVLVDPTDPADVAKVNALQDRFDLRAASSRPFEPSGFDTASLDATRAALLERAKVSPFEHAFGKKGDVDPEQHLIATAAGWGGLPREEASYVGVDPGLPVGEYSLTVREVPVDAFWSISVYNKEGYFEPNDRGAYSVNNITATPNADGSITVHFGGCEGSKPNCLPITEGWNYTVRLYRPRQEILDGSWTFPAIEGR